MTKQLVTRAELAKIRDVIMKSAALIKPIRKIESRVRRYVDKNWAVASEEERELHNALVSLDFDAKWCLRQVRDYESTLRKREKAK